MGFGGVLVIERLGVWSGGCEILGILASGKVGFRGVGGGDGGKWRRLHGGWIGKFSEKTDVR